ncbi:allophanate hydrolase (plasmid) [Rhizobium sp. NIBRBAC000502774]|nr:allophanate hydrolase [Rhizobium sp. NIBRBAC000502774]
MNRQLTILGFDSLREAYDEGVNPTEIISLLYQRTEQASDKAIFISMASREQSNNALSKLLNRAPVPNSLPLWGLPFVVKDNIDVAGVPTTAGCPDFAYMPEKNATVVDRLIEAGAIFIGKTNLDQFATGLNGTRSPYGAPRCVFDERYISGGSSSGSAVAVAAGLVSFALGTDTAGSGRVPAAMNNIVGIKPTPGRVPNTGVVPACRSIDVVTVFAASVSDGVEVRKIMEGYDAADAYSQRLAETIFPGQLKLGIPSGEELTFFGNEENRKLFARTVETARALGADIVEIDYRPFREAASLLYGGPWVAERLAATETILRTDPVSIDPIVRGILESATTLSALDVFKGEYRLEKLKQETRDQWAKIDALLLPTVPSTYTVEEMRLNPVELNSNLGYYTNFANFLRCAAIAVPAGFSNDGLPFGVQVVAPQNADNALSVFASALHEAGGTGAGIDRHHPLPQIASEISNNQIQIAVVGAHLTGMPLNRELTERNGRFIRPAKTAPQYRLYKLEGTVPAKPGLMREEGYEGSGIDLEIWSLSPENFATFVASIPKPLGIGKIVLSDGSEVSGFICEPAGFLNSIDITSYGGWKKFQKLH